ncbi:MAG: hypothetical protein RDU25_06245 [Patescibacteria group bacterium]|nr:hypothetical protein [Patescibacteria group bacterium]
MGVLTNAFNLTERQRNTVVVLIVALLLTSVRVQAAETSDVLPDVMLWETGKSIHDDNQQGGIFVAEKLGGELHEAKAVPPTDIRYVTVTAFSSVPWQTDDSPFITADGSRVGDGIIAANFLKFGTRVRIPALFGDKVFEVHDRMNKRYSNRVDVWMPTVAKCRQFGVKRNIKIEILR